MVEIGKYKEAMQHIFCVLTQTAEPKTWPLT
jgi:hypothetical protein